MSSNDNFTKIKPDNRRETNEDIDKDVDDIDDNYDDYNIKEARESVHETHESKKEVVDKITKEYKNAEKRYEERASGPGIIFARDGKTIYNFNHKCPPVPYCRSYNIDASNRDKIVYYIPDIILVNDQPNEEAVHRSDFLFDNLQILLIMLILMHSFAFSFKYVGSITKFLEIPELVLADLLLEIITFLLIIFLRKKSPYNWILIVIFSLTTGYLLAHQFVELEVDLIFTSIGITIILIILMGLITWFRKIEFTNFYFLINPILVLIGVVICITLIILYWVTLNYGYLLYMYYIFVGILLLDLMHRFHLIMGRGEYGLQLDEEVFGASTTFLDIVFIYLIMPILVSGYYYHKNYKCNVSNKI